MAKKGATYFKAGSKPKSPAKHNKSKKQQSGRRRVNEPAVITPAAEDNDEEWDDDENDDEEQTAPKTNGGEAEEGASGDGESSEEDDDSGESGDEEQQGAIDLAAIDDSDSESELEPDGEDEAKVKGKERSARDEEGEEEDDEEEEEEEEEIDVDELSAIDEEDEEQIAAGTRIRQTINNKEGLLAALRRIALDTNPKTVPFAFHQSVVSSKRTEESIPSVDDDLQRELAFMSQALEAAQQGRALLRREGVPFTRPTDYFAETVRSDATMEKVKAKLVEEATAKKAAAEARKQRDLKKFGKQVQVQKQLERAKQKRETLEKINLLKRKRQEGGSAPLGTTEVDDLFDVAVDNELASHSSHSNKSKKRSASAGDRHAPNAKRQKKDSKFGFGGKKRFGKSGDALSSGDLSGFSAKRMKSSSSGGGGGGGKKGGKAPRLGKSRRKAMAAKR